MMNIMVVLHTKRVLPYVIEGLTSKTFLLALLSS